MGSDSQGEKNQYISEWAKNVTIKKKSLMFMRARVERDGMSSQFHTEMYALPPASLFVLSGGRGRGTLAKCCSQHFTLRELCVMLECSS